MTIVSFVLIFCEDLFKKEKMVRASINRMTHCREEKRNQGRLNLALATLSNDFALQPAQKKDPR